MHKLHLKMIVPAIVVLVVIGYAYGRVEAFIAGPRLHISSPQAGESVSPFVTLSATALNTEEVFLNDRLVFADEQGGIRESLLLFPGYNVVTLSAKDRFGRMSKKEIEFVYKPI